MSSDDQPGQTTGSVPHAYRNALFWRWVPAMPGGLPSGFVTTLYALASAADPSGKVQFRDGKAIRIKDIAAGIKADEKDVRRYLKAAIAAGVVAVLGEQRRGRAALYVLVLSPSPAWDSAAWVLEQSKRKRVDRGTPPWRADDTSENGGRSPELSTSENGGPPPELPEEPVRGTAPRLSSGDRPPFGSGDRPPNIPGIAKGLPQEMADAVHQPQVVGPDGHLKIDLPHEEDDHDPARAAPGWTRCADCAAPIIHRAGRPPRARCTTCDTHTATA